MNLLEAYSGLSEILEKDFLLMPPYPSNFGYEAFELMDFYEDNPNINMEDLEGWTMSLVMNPWQRAYQCEYRFKPSKLFADYRQIIESATYDLMCGNYICSYMCILPVVQAVLSKWALDLNLFKDDGFDLVTYRKKIIKHIKEKIKTKEADSKIKKWMINQSNYLDLILKDMCEFVFNSLGTYNLDTSRLLTCTPKGESLQKVNMNLYMILDFIAELYLYLETDLYKENTFDTDHNGNIDFNLRWKIYKSKLEARIKLTDMDMIRFGLLDNGELSTLSDNEKLRFLKETDSILEIA